MRDEIVSVASISSLRRLSPSSRTRAIVGTSGEEGTFFCDWNDQTSSDDGALVIVTNNGKRMKRSFSGPIDVRWFGAKGDGVTDDTVALQAAINAAIEQIGGYRGGAVVWLPPGDYRITSTLTIYNVSGLSFRGAGKEATRLLWDGSYSVGTYTPMILLSSCQGCVVESLQLQAQGGKRVSVGIHLITGTGGQFVSARNKIRNVKASTDGRMDECILFGGTHATAGNDANNDFHIVERCDFFGYRRYGIRLDNTQVFDISIDNVLCIGAWSTSTATIANGSAIATVPAGVFNTDDVDTMIEIVGAGVAGGTLRAFITAVGATTLELSVGASTTVANATLRYGSQAAGYMRRGNFFWRGGGGNGNLDADWILGITNGAPAEIVNVNGEGSRRFIRGMGPFGGSRPVRVSNFRWAGDSVLTDHREVVALLFPGDFLFENGSIGDRGTDRDCRIFWSWGPSVIDRARMVMRNVLISGESASGPAGLFTQNPPTMVDNCALSRASDEVPFGCIERVYAAGSGARTLYLNWPASKMTINGATMLAFEGLPVGIGTVQRLRLVHTGGPHVVTWPTITWLGGDPALSADDWFEFWTDGETIWGKKL